MSHKTQTEDEFFIGWERQVPKIQRRFLYNRLIGIFAFSFSLALLIPALQNRYEPSFYRSMTVSNFEGVFYSQPVPHLMVTRPGSIRESLQPVSDYFLVKEHKFGFSPEKAEEIEGKTIRLKGSLIYNRKQTIIEVDEKSISQISFDDLQSQPDPQRQHLGRYKLSGIIVDSKCYYGALNPGYGKPHRACSVRSIANGIPPLLIIHSETGDEMELLITGPEGEGIGPMILERVEVPVRVTGDVFRWGDKYIIQTEPRLIETLEEA